MMNDYEGFKIALVVTFVFVLIFTFGFYQGKDVQYEKIYNNCLETNASMSYGDVVVKCKNIVGDK